MRRHILLFIAFCLQIAARGQAITDLDLSEVLKPPIQAQSLLYWFDSDTSNMQTPSGLSGTHILDVATLDEGLHTLHYQVTGTDGKTYALFSAVFLKMINSISVPITSAAIAASKLQYWFDTNTDNMQTANGLSGTYILDVAHLEDGLHTIHYQVTGTDGKTYALSSAVFLKMINSIAEPITNAAIVASKLQYWFDTNTDNMQTVNGLSGTYILDVAHLEDGLHTIHYQVVGMDGTGYDEASSVFLKMASSIAETAIAEAPVATKMQYWFNKDAASAVQTDVANGIQMIDVSTLPSGLHTLYYQLVYDNGQVGPTAAGIFLKEYKWPGHEGDNGITKYQYWVNDNSSTSQTVVLNETQNPFTLISLLPVRRIPIRTSSFHFEVKEGQPTIYAKNDLHIRFYDARGYFVDDGKSFIDYGVKQEVEPVGELMPTQTFDRVANNAIRWYTISVEPGDTAAFKLSQPATVQVFAPSGTEVFKTSEAASVKWGGIHTWEDGTYYLAVHDVTGSKEDMTLEYMHMDKYDVVDWDVHIVGNGGCSTITFKGNGFRDLYAVDLVIAPGDTIHSIDVSHDSDAETAVTFDFTGATFGEYNAVFHFTEEDKPVANVVTVEESKDIELATAVTYPSTFLRGTSTTYTIKITNKGNMTAYDVPIYTFIQSNEGVNRIKYDGLNLTSYAEAVCTDGMSEKDKEIIQSVSDDLCDDWQFVRFIVPDDNKNGDSVTVCYNYFFTNISPNTTKVLTLTLYCTTDVNVYMTVPPDWKELSSELPSKLRKASSQDEGFNYCCIRESVECLADVATSRLDVAAAVTSIISLMGGQVEIAGAVDIADCLAGIGNSSLKSIGYSYCGNAGDIKDALNTDKSWMATIISCVGGKIGNILGAGIGNSGNYGNIMRSIALDFMIPGIPIGTISDMYKCYKKMGKPAPGCPPVPPKGGTSSMRNSCEPNDILGYVAESGSKAIKEGHTDVFYTIQFENDTVFATAPAHDIYLTDTLDVNLFDLSTYRPTRITIGNKSMELTGERNFISTMDMRPEINAIAQIEGTINDRTGIVRWHISSLDPMTMEPSDDPMVGVLPVNFDGSGLGEASFEISLKPNLPDGTIIPNRSGNVFDNNETVLTPTWTNIVDAVAPSSVIDNSWMVNDSTLRITADAFDARSGVWRYTWYVQAGENAPWWEEGETESPQFDYHIFEGIDYGFCVLATDSAGNVEQKVIERERGFKTYGQDYEDGISPLPISPEEEGPAYDLSGRQIENGKSSSRKNRKGIIIRNRKKTLVTE